MLKIHKNREHRWLTALWCLAGTYAIAKLSLLLPVSAHTIKTGGDVAVTFHIDPDHNPKAGEKATAWFAMTRRGGKAIPFQECHCKLAVYLDSEGQNSVQTMSTALKSISAENNADIPAAELVFPKSGIYQLEFSGTPKQKGVFKPFRLFYSVTVIPGSPVTSPVSSTASNRSNANPGIQNTSQNSTSIALWSFGGGAAILGAIASLVYRQRRRKPAND